MGSVLLGGSSQKELEIKQDWNTEEGKGVTGRKLKEVRDMLVGWADWRC